MDERTCDQCGAQNPMDAAYCWQCYARWDGSASPSAPVRPGTIRAAPAEADGGGPGGSVLTAHPPPHVGARAGRSRGRLLAAAVVFVAGFAGGWWLVDHLFFGGFAFEIPDGIDPTTLQGFPIGDVPFQCRPETEGSSCFWQHNRMIVGV